MKVKSIFGLFLIQLLLHTVPANSQSVGVVTFDQLAHLVNRPTDTLYVVNFWATWCAPCVKELPEFERTRQAYAHKKVQVLLVSMDDKADLNRKVNPFVRNRKIQSRVVLLNEPDLNSWVDKLAPEWSGALPMTLIINRQRSIRQYIGRPVKEGELTTILEYYKL